MHFLNIHSFLRKTAADLFYFWDIYDINLWEKNFGRSKTGTAEVRLKLELDWHFMVREWKTVKMQLDSWVIRLLKQENVCGAIALTYFFENCLDLP